MVKTHATWLLPLLVGLLSVEALRADDVGDYAEVTVEEAPVRSGEETLMRAKKGEKFEIIEIREPFFGVQVTLADGQRRKGYLWNQHAQAVPPPLAPLYTPPPPEPYVRVTAGEATIRVGKTALGSVRAGRVLRVEKQQPGWFWVQPTADAASAGWLQAKAVEPLPHHGPSQDGVWPTSIQQARVTWSKDGFVISSPLSAADETPLVLAAADRAVDEVERSGNRIEVRLADESPLAPGTKSLWIAEQNGRQHRVDLPTPELASTASSTRYDSSPELQYLSIEVTDAAPGMWLEGCQVRPDREKPRLRPLDRKGSAELSFTDLYEFQGKTYVRIGLRDVSDDFNRWVYLRAHTPWGGRSRTVALRRVGNKVEPKATRFEDHKSGFVDAVAEVPNVELMPVDLAEQVLKEAGLQVEIVSAADLTKVASPDPRALVSRQGVAAGATMLLGKTLLLSIGNTPEVARPESASGLTIDVLDAFALASLKPHSAADFAPDENGLQWLTAQPNATGVLSLGADGGVSLDPDRSATRTNQAAFLKLMLLATLNNPPEAMPGSIGEVFRQLISVEDRIQQRIRSDRSLEIGRVAERVAQLLAAELSAADRSALEDDWQRYRQHRTTPADYDLQGNQFVGDDLALWTIQWLFDHGKYDPLESTVPAADTRGRPLAVLFQPGRAPQWSREVGMPITPPGQTAPTQEQLSGLIASLNQQAPSSAPPEQLIPDSPSRSEPPRGEPLVYAGDGPTHVRVPPVVRQPVSTADEELRKLGLRIARADRLLDTDRVIASRPEARAWVDSGSGVELQAERRVPDVLGYTPDRVDRELERWNFQARRDGPAGSSDVAVDQQPAAGQFASVDDPIVVRFRVLMPDLVGKFAKDGLDLLQQRDLRYRVQTKIFLRDRIVAQEPAAGTLLDHGDTADLVVHAQVPSLVGRTLAQAQAKLEEYDLRAETPNRLARDGDTVRGQRPLAGQYVPHGSDVRLAPIVTFVPNVVGLSLGEAETVLQQQNDLGVRPIGPLLARDRITNQTPRQGTEIERGQTVVLDGRVPIPDVRGDNLYSATNRIRSAGGELAVDVEGSGQNTDVVYSQNPNPGVLAMPRSTVSLTPGVMIPSVSGLSVNEARQRLARVNVDSRVTSSGTQETRDRGMAGQTVVSGQSHQGLHPRRGIGQVRLGVTEYVLPVRIVPRVVEMTPAAAIAAIEREDLRVDTVVVTIVPRGGTRRMSVGEFRTFMFGQALASLIGGNSSEQARIESAYASHTQARAGTRLVAGDSVDLFVDVRVSYGEGNGERPNR
ncbi:PASTA domain-containing protein [Roseimaritima sediminicola]|uniref:PASTA domain-containing protein n=1 Tax=Roseimaritima sediminicola TaxID=2662066 RepID=UPI001298448A|nr:PASTA domain-containing protein [Roseimaritima sediminicola]